jgi:peroxiredoxin Q/BCP
MRRALLFAFLVACKGSSQMLAVGAVAPDVTAKDPKGHDVKLSDSKGHPAVVYFYPKDGTPGCTSEACAFRDAWNKYQTANVTIIGVSRDSEESHRKFVAEHHLPFPLAADESGAIEKAYGVSSTLGMTSRVTFLIAPDGTIAHVWPDVDPGVHATEVLDAAGKLSVGKGSE